MYRNLPPKVVGSNSTSIIAGSIRDFFLFRIIIDNIGCILSSTLLILYNKS